MIRTTSLAYAPWHARRTSALEKQLKADTFDIDPDKVQIQIDKRSRSAASTQTLTDFALTHFKDLDKTHFKLVSLDNTAIPQDMDQSYIKDLIRNLKLGETSTKDTERSLCRHPGECQGPQEAFLHAIALAADALRPHGKIAGAPQRDGV